MTANPEQIESPPTIEKLRTEHQDHERRLEELKQQQWLSPEEQIEEKRLKKLKLHLKDQIEQLRKTALFLRIRSSEPRQMTPCLARLGKIRINSPS